jgi:general stress protein 26
MNTIDKQQPEDTRDDLQGRDAIAQIKTIVAQAKTCFFCTAVATGDSNGVRPMNVRHVDDDGNLWFLSAAESHQNHELALDPTVKLYFQGSPNSDFMHLTGQATISRDRVKIRELWQPFIRTWFTGGVDDPRITVIKVAPTGGYYWDTKHGHVVAGVKMLFGAIIGKTIDDSVEGTLRVR